MFKFFQQKEANPENMDDLLAQFKNLKEEFGRVSDELEKMKQANKLNVQKVGIIRFNPFSEVGGDQSFSLAFLDANDNGVVITSLYTRKENRVYGKPVKNGGSQYLLSDEEMKAIESAKNYINQNANGTEQSNNQTSDRRGVRAH